MSKHAVSSVMNHPQDLESQASPSESYPSRSSEAYRSGYTGRQLYGDPALTKTSSQDEHGTSEADGWVLRIRYFHWTFFTLTMATGGIANVIFACPLSFHGLYTIGVMFMFLGIIFFLVNCVCISLRFYHWPSTFKASLLDQTESLFVPAPVISICVILITITQYAVLAQKTGPWLVKTMTVCYWIYIALAFASSVTIYLTIWARQTHAMSTMTPVWIFPAYPLLLVGPLAGQLSSQQIGQKSLDIIVGGVIVQGIGFMVSLTIYAAYISRLMTEKLPAESSRPAMFISVGPSAFTIAGLINMGENVAQSVGPGFMGNGALAADVSRILANWVGIFLWGLALWFFFVSVAAHWTCVSHGRMHFAMTWNSFIFPNTALALATFAVAAALDDNKAIEVVGAVMLGGLIVLWFFVMSMMIRAIYLKHILWPPEGDLGHLDSSKPDAMPSTNGHTTSSGRSAVDSSASKRRRLT